MNYNDMYNLIYGIFLTFNNPDTIKGNKRLMSVSHSQKKRDANKYMFNDVINKYKSWTRQDFISAILLVMFYKSPSSVEKLIEYLKDLPREEVYNFKNEIINYRKFTLEEINKINKEYLTLNIDEVVDMYKHNKIKWFTFYFYVLALGYNMQELKLSRLESHLIKKVRKMLLFVTFSEKTIIDIKNMIKNNDKLIKI